MPTLNIELTQKQPITSQTVAQKIRDNLSLAVVYQGKTWKLLSDQDLNRLQEHIEQAVQTAATEFETLFDSKQPWTSVDSLAGKCTPTPAFLPGNTVSCAGLTGLYFNTFHTNLQGVLSTWLCCKRNEQRPLFHLPQELPNANALVSSILILIANGSK